jgi:hypothetical protein
MMDWTKISEEFYKFLALPASKQIIGVILFVTALSVVFNISSYLSKRKADALKDRQIIEYKTIIDKNVITKDSLILVIYNIKLSNFEDNLKRSDSLLKESQKIRNSVLKIKK